LTSSGSSDLTRRAQEVLARNRRGTWTCPATDLYPHQWLWDSCFVAIGVARYDPRRAADELRALFRGQWANGMLPHVIFDDDVPDTASTRIWQSRRNPLAPRDVATSCITQPPMPAVAVRRVARSLPPDDRAAFAAELYPRLVAYHEWLYRERDPHRRGLLTLIHPWECGLDTTPPWMDAIARMPRPWWARAAARLHLAYVMRFLRRDTKYVPTVQRPTDAEGLGMLVLAQLAREHGFELRRMPPDRSVLVEDLAFNAILVAANRSLAAIALEIDRALPADLEERAAGTEAAIEQLWDDSAGQYFSRDAITGTLVRMPTIATFLPLFAGVVPDARVPDLVDRLRTPTTYWPRFPVPTVPVDAPEFREEGYWKGPTWVNTNWMVVEGLRGVGAAEVADELRERTLALVGDAGFSEYFSALSGRGYGAPEFSWTAALALDLVAGAT
jgi:hypothetical protein